jgi:hypothetical protein
MHVCISPVKLLCSSQVITNEPLELARQWSVHILYEMLLIWMLDNLLQNIKNNKFFRQLCTHFLENIWDLGAR